MDIDKAFNLLVDLKKMLGPVKWGLDYGSLLGAVREGNIIRWDFDTDAFILEEELLKPLKLNDRCKPYGLRVWCGFVKFKGFSIKCLTFSRGGVSCHMQGLKKLGSFRYKPVVRFIKEKPEEGIKKTFDKFWVKLPLRYFEQLRTAKIRDVEFNIPDHAEEYLTAMYGDWKTPHKHGQTPTDWLCRPKYYRPDYRPEKQD